MAETRTVRNKRRKLYVTVREIGVEMSGIERRLHDAGLHGTAHKVNAAQQELGWEAARRLRSAP